MADKPLCDRCAGVDWMEAGLPRCLSATQPSLFSTSDQVRLPDGKVVSTNTQRLTESSQMLCELATVSEIQARRLTCHFCDFFLVLLHQHFSSSDIDKATRGKIPLCIYTCKYGVVTETSYEDTRTFNIMCFQLAFSAEFVCGSSARFTLLQPYNEHIQSEITASDIPTLLSRPVPARIDPKQIKSWMKACDAHHGPLSASHPQSSFLSHGPSSSDIRVVDVVNRCIKVIPLRHPDCRYVALSYVWGVEDQEIKLTTENLAAFSKPGGIPTLSKTVEDALNITKAIGLQYFWADLISIIQDDDEDKASYIFDMDKVYTWSSLTIAAVAGGTCHEGLYGVGRDRIPLLQVASQGVGLIEIQDQPRRPHRALTVTSGWPSRCWTLQEFVMSQKVLLLCEQQAIWICRGADWVEGLEMGRACFRFEDYGGLNRPRLRSPVFADIGRSISSNDASSLADLSDAATLIECYSSRNLSYENDVKNAFEGLTWYMSSLSPDRLPSFCWGLPETHFEAFLCWSGRSSSSDSPGVFHRRATYPDAPSWSWMAWRGPIRFPRLTFLAYDQSWKSYIKCFKYPTYLHRQGREWNGVNSGYEAEDTILSRPYDMFEDSCLPLMNQCSSLFFWAECTQIRLDTASLAIHFERNASCVRNSDGRLLPVQNLNISGQITDKIRNSGSVDVMLVGVIAEMNSPDSEAIDHVNSRNASDMGPNNPFEIWNRQVYCLLVSNHGSNHVQREGMLVLKTADWYHTKKELKLLVLD